MPRVLSSTINLTLFSHTAPSSRATEILGIQPTTTSERGEQSIAGDPNSRVFDRSTWLYSPSEEVEQAGLEPLDHVLELLSEKTSALKTLSEEFSVLLSLSVTVDSWEHTFTLPASKVAQIGDLGLDFEVSVWDSAA